MDGDDDGALGQDADGRALAVGLPGHGLVANVVLAHRRRRLLHAGITRVSRWQ
ncbi:hypothetical protein [Janthinobacterium sp. HLX7-2]|uniref:hypothetical protein n=1 Tax=Janthinobacterium sp. HLX7-2 TaxID=1259331 RepID=UPI003F5273E4